MSTIDFSALPLWQNLAAFALAAGVIWFAGSRLSRYADEISNRTRLSKAFLGVLLLGGITSLPELGTTVSASALGNAPLALNNLFGGVAMQVAILALADAVLRRRSLTTTFGSPVVMLQGLLCILILAMATAAMIVGEVAVAGVGLWATAILLVFLGGLYLTKMFEDDPGWARIDEAGNREEEGEGEASRPAAESEAKAGEGDAGGGESTVKNRRRRRNGAEDLSSARLALYTAASGLAILVAGYLLAVVGEVLAEQTGLGSSFVGAVLVAVATSLPEVTTTVEAVRIGSPSLALSNIFGANLFDVGLLFAADVVYRGAPVLDEVGTFSQFAALLGIVLTLIYMVGVLGRSRVVILRLGWDSLLVLALYLAGAYVLFTMR